MNSETLAELRSRIDALDDKVIALLRERIRLSNSIMQAKAPGTIVDPAREREIVQRYADGLAGVSTAAKLKRLVSAVIGISSVYPD